MKRKVEQYLKNKYGPDVTLKNLDGHYEYTSEDLGPLLQFIKTSMKHHPEMYKEEVIMAKMVESYSSFSVDESAARLRKKQLIEFLHIACKQSNEDMVKKFLAARADENAEDDVSICFKYRYSIVMVLYVHYAL